MAAKKVLIGVVGYSPLIDAFPLGPRLMAQLQVPVCPEIEIQVENMTWSPIHIVQRFQDRSLVADRLVLVGSADACAEPGRVTCCRWQGGSMAPALLQDRIYEAVTGVVSLDNTLMIGEHFGVWPQELYTIELEMPPNAFGEIVMAESEYAADRASLLVRLGFDPVSAGDRLSHCARALACDGEVADVDLHPKSAASLLEHTSFSHIEVVSPRAGTAR